MGKMLTGLEPSVFAFYPPTSGSIPTSLPLDSTPFFSLNGLSKETMVGHLGTRMSLKGTDLFLAGGTDYTPLGLRSSLIPTTRTPFMEVGTRRNVLRRGRNTLSLLSTYGYSAGEYLTAHVANLGIRYDRAFRYTTLSFHTNYRGVFGAMGIPGYQEAGAARTSFITGHPELRVFFTLR